MGRPVGKAHFQLFADTPWAPVNWRLLSSNNRVLGRNTEPAADMESATLAIKKLAALIEGSEAQLRPTAEHRWRWTLLCAGVPIARSGHDYDRKVRCSSAVASFTVLAPDAAILEGVMIMSARREVRPQVVPIGGRFAVRAPAAVHPPFTPASGVGSTGRFR